MCCRPFLPAVSAAPPKTPTTIAAALGTPITSRPDTAAFSPRAPAHCYLPCPRRPGRRRPPALLPPILLRVVDIDATLAASWGCADGAGAGGALVAAATPTSNRSNTTAAPPASRGNFFHVFSSAVDTMPTRLWPQTFRRGLAVGCGQNLITFLIPPCPAKVVWPSSCTVTIRLYGTLAHFVAPVPAMHSHGAPRRDVLVSLPIVPILTEKGDAGALDRKIERPVQSVDHVRG